MIELVKMILDLLSDGAEEDSDWGDGDLGRSRSILRRCGQWLF